MIGEVKKQLTEVGLTEHEASIYEALLGHSPASASFVAKKCGLARSSVYTAISALVSKGLVGTTYKNEIKQFVAGGASAIEDYLKKERHALENKFRLLDTLKQNVAAISYGEMKIPQIIFFEGQDSLKKIYLSMLREAPANSVIYTLRDEFVWRPEWTFIFEKEWGERVKRWRSEKNIKAKLLINDSKEERAKLPYYKSRKDTSFKFLPKKNSVKDFVVYILGDVSAILSMEKGNLVGIKITNKNIAENFRAMFDSMWK